jgi:hypothetical protein
VLSRLLVLVVKGVRVGMYSLTYMSIAVVRLWSIDCYKGARGKKKDEKVES